jgi:hypothetical protein
LILSSSLVWGGAEESQKVTVISLDAVGTGETSISLPIYDCVGRCSQDKAWTISVPKRVLKTTKEEVEKDFLNSEFDYIKQIGDTLLFEIKERSFSGVVEKRESIFREPISGEVFKSAILNYINRDGFKNPTKKLLIDSLSTKVSGNLKLDQSARTRVLNRTYLLVPYLEKLEGEFYIIGSRKDGGYKLELKLNTILRVSLFKYDTARGFLHFGDFVGESFEIDDSDTFSYVYGINYFDSEFQEIPKKRDGEELLKENVSKSFGKAYKNALLKIRDLEDFKVFQQVEDIEGRVAYFTSSENIAIDTPLYFYNNEKEYLGWGKIYDKDRNSSTYETKLLSADEVAPETFISPYDWSGYLFGIELRKYYSSVTYFGYDYFDIDGTTLALTGKADIANFLDWKIVSEFWITASLYTGFETVSGTAIGYLLDADFEYLYGYEIGLEYRYYLFSPLYFTAGGDFGSRYSKYKIFFFNQVYKNNLGGEHYGDGYLINISHYLRPKAGVGYSFSPNLELFGEVGYTLPMFQSNSIQNSGGYELNIGTISTSEFELKDYLSFSFGFLFHYDYLNE